MRAIAAAGPIGLLGGTFDPVHAGHLQLGADAERALGLAQLRLLPAGQPWQKDAVTPAYHRLAMLELALHERAQRRPDVPGPGGTPWVVDTREIARTGPSYTVDTLREIRAAVGPAAPLVWILGYDQLRGLPSWHEWQSLVQLAHIAYAQRAGEATRLDGALDGYVAARRGTAAQLASRPAGSFVQFPMQAVDCSATRLRAALAAGDTAGARTFLCPAVLGYIQTHQLYLAVHGQ
jgi:nicotinate-nucleotide adenylyltransferase